MLGVALGVAICAVGFPLADTLYGCSGVSCAPTVPPQVIVSQNLLFGGAAFILISLAALHYSSEHPRAISWVCSILLVIGGAVLVSAELYSINPVVLIPSVILSGNVISPGSATDAQISFIVCTVKSNSDFAPRCNPKPDAQSYNATIQQGSFSVSLPNGLSYNATASYTASGNRHYCPSVFVTVMSYSPSMTLPGNLGC